MHSVPPFPLNYLREPKVPRNSRIVIFAGNLNPPDAIAGRWNEEEEHRAPLDHLRAAFGGGRREGLSKHLRHYLLPATWVKDLWRE